MQGAPLPLPRWTLGLGMACLPALLPPTARAQAPSMEELMRRIEALQRRVEELEAAQAPSRRAAPPVAAPAPRQAARPPAPGIAAPTAPAAAPPGTAAARRPAPASPSPAASPLIAAAPAGPPAAAPTPEAQRQITRAAVDEALRGEMPGSIRIPGTDTSVRLYGFIKTNVIDDINARNRSDAPSVQSVDLYGSGAYQQAGDIQFTARRSRVGFETRTPTGWGPLNTRLEADFAGDQPSAAGSATSGGYMLRLRHAYAEVGGDEFRVLVGQTNSLWNEGLLETLTDSSFVNASSVRQAQLRVTARLAQGLVGQVSMEAPYTDFLSNDGVFYPDSNLQGGASPSQGQVPDLLGRLTWSGSLGETSLRGVLRQLNLDTNGTAATPDGTASTLGWGLALHGKLNLREIWDAFGYDQLIAMGYYGQGIGRYFDATTSGSSAFSDIGLSGASRVTLEALPSYGVVAAYQHYWAQTLRSTAAYGYAHVDYPEQVALLTPGGAGALAANRELQMALVNLIWSPFARTSGSRISNGWLDAGIELGWYRRDIEGGATAAAGKGGHGILQRLQASAIVRF